MKNETFKEDFFINLENIKLYRQIYNPINDPPKAVVFVSHGLFEHCQANYYETIIEPMRESGCLVITHDHYGHGRSEGTRGVIRDISVLVRDVILDIEETIKNLKLSKSVPVFVYGHSMGGLVAVLAALDRKDLFKGVMLEGPFLAHNVSRVTIMIARSISYIYPLCPIQAIDYKEISRDTEYIEGTRHDPLRIHFKVPAITGVSLINGLNNCKIAFKDFLAPVIIGHGECDQLSLASGSKLFIEHISSTDKSLIIYPKAKHQIRKETENVNVEFKNTVISWLKERMG